jgi:hypothetical protein
MHEFIALIFKDPTGSYLAAPHDGLDRFASAHSGHSCAPARSVQEGETGRSNSRC